MNREICFLILAHSAPDQLKRLIRSLQHPHCYFLVHVDAKSDIGLFRKELEGVPRLRFLEKKMRVGVNWGGYSQTHAILTLLQEGFDWLGSAQRFYLLSGACYPAVTTDALIALADSDIQMVNGRHYAPGTKRYDRIANYHLRDHVLLNARGALPIDDVKRHRYLRRTLREYVDAFAESMGKPAELPLPYYSGSTWWSLSREAAAYVLEFCRREHAIMQLFRYSGHADEGLIQTIIHNSDFKVQTAAMHYVDWSSDAIQTGKYLDESAIGRLEPHHLFVRKVNAQTSAKLMDLLDERRGTGRL